ncbi:hypothetical protein PVA45_03475 [Entomospira entomophila]|uniref:Tetratricopeptide repeat protein n=1 Tax=Entomospira entomophila TaxID=2719988 RepID=A0A968G8L0_9SPIO|nr:tetratricopeptide repeat protein [Entomospira entomophilus]NIZ40572.1 hypothetical protein [Entomospira entomophilus]WDI36130.1 hypothetical protein PVA45_03475 [Entomospira entomophilus]
MRLIFLFISILVIGNIYAVTPKEYAQRLYTHGSAYHAEGDLVRARNHYEYALEIYPLEKRIYASLSYLYVEIGMIHKGIETLSRAIELFPKDTDLLYHRAYFYTLIHRNDLALNDWNRIISLDKKNIEARWQRGHYHLKAEEYHDALDDFRMLDRYDTDPSKISTFFLAQTLQMLGQYDAAAKKFMEYASAVEHHGSYWHPIGEAYFYIAQNLRLAGQEKEAALYYGKAIDAKLWPGVTPAQRVEAQKYSDHYLSIVK